MHSIFSAKVQRFLLFFNALMLTIFVAINQNLKTSLSGLQGQLPRDDSSSASSSSAKKDGDFTIPASSNLAKVLVLLTELSKLYMKTIQIQKIQYSQASSSADITIKSYELDDLDSYLKSFEATFKKENFSIVQIVLDDTQDDEKEPEIVLEDDKPKEILPFALAYLREQKKRAEANDVKTKQAAGYGIVIKVAL
jgi:hypothetical protein